MRKIKILTILSLFFITAYAPKSLGTERSKRRIIPQKKVFKVVPTKNGVNAKNADLDLKKAIEASKKQEKIDEAARRKKQEEKEQKELEAVLKISKQETQKNNSKESTGSVKETQKNDQVKQNSDLISISVAAQKGSDCGYHAVYNGWLIFSYLCAGTTDRKILSEQASRYNGKLIEEWRQAILKKYSKRDPKLKGGDLQDDEILYIAKDLVKLNPDTFTIIPNIREGYSAQIYQDQVKRIRELRLSRNISHIFLLGSMNGYSVAQHTGTIGHWISVVFYKVNGKITYYIMDSLSSSSQSGRNVLMKSLEELIEHMNLDKLVLAKS